MMAEVNLSQILNFTARYRQLIFTYLGIFSIITIHILSIAYTFSPDIIKFIDFYYIGSITLVFVLLIAFASFLGRVFPIFVFLIVTNSLLGVYTVSIYTTIIFRLIKKRKLNQLKNEKFHEKIFVFLLRNMAKKAQQRAVIINKSKIIVQFSITFLTFSYLYVGLRMTLLGIPILIVVAVVTGLYFFLPHQEESFRKLPSIDAIFDVDVMPSMVGFLVAFVMIASAFFGVARAIHVMESDIFYLNSQIYTGKVKVIGKTSSGFIVGKIDSNGIIYLPLDGNPVFSIPN